MLLLFCSARGFLYRVCAELCYRSKPSRALFVFLSWRPSRLEDSAVSALTAICYCSFLATLVGSPKICSAMSHSNSLSRSLFYPSKLLSHRLSPLYSAAVLFFPQKVGQTLTHAHITLPSDTGILRTTSTPPVSLRRSDPIALFLPSTRARERASWH